ncbi:hypothetical protein BC937DRAFT_88388 [Endogone sp. FLAS-F59071]|nr:hypothetical protein BC937DRAFT_88388 [Endogone sp. FLAS-F59071]|eukprot:RUS18753.1 hypothetical protein BC937DRAFT_88388 [Endogone sp. FLAS-F59071]
MPFAAAKNIMPSSAAGTGGFDNANQAVSAKSYCELPPFVGGSAPPNRGVGYVSVDGHYFSAGTPLRFYPMITSSSLSICDMQAALPNTPVYNLLASTHNNRLGAVYGAINWSIETRLTTLRNGAAGS